MYGTIISCGGGDYYSYLVIIVYSEDTTGTILIDYKNRYNRYIQHVANRTPSTCYIN